MLLFLATPAVLAPGNVIDADTGVVPLANVAADVIGGDDAEFDFDDVFLLELFLLPLRLT